jgi:hypothetical protein
MKEKITGISFLTTQKTAEARPPGARRRMEDDLSMRRVS